MPKSQYIGEPFSTENPGTICEFMETDAIEMRKPSNVYWVEVTDVYHDGFVPAVKKSIKAGKGSFFPVVSMTGLLASDTGVTSFIDFFTEGTNPSW